MTKPSDDEDRRWWQRIKTYAAEHTIRTVLMVVGTVFAIIMLSILFGVNPNRLRFNMFGMEAEAEFADKNQAPAAQVPQQASGPTPDDIAKVQEELRLIERDTDRLTGVRQERQREVQLVHAELQQLQEQRDQQAEQHRLEAERHAQRIRQAEQLLQAKQAELQGASSELTQLRAEHEQIQSELEEQAQVLLRQQTQERLLVERRELDANRVLLQACRNEVARKQEEIEQLEAQFVSQSTRHEQSLTALQRNVARARSSLTQQQRLVRQAESELSDLNQRIANKAALLELNQQALAEVSQEIENARNAPVEMVGSIQITRRLRSTRTAHNGEPTFELTIRPRGLNNVEGPLWVGIVMHPSMNMVINPEPLLLRSGLHHQYTLRFSSSHLNDLSSYAVFIMNTQQVLAVEQGEGGAQTLLTVRAQRER